ncbi:MAG: hypothetical protein KJ064_17470 [Anaerolineae bacterium]|jgi:hypothetical protein|nr:hypothetical protein [Anaerolineae bacterium]
MIESFKAYTEGLKFMTDQKSTEDILGFELSAETKARVAELLGKKRSGTLTAKENAELVAYEDVALFVEMKKRQAEQNH